MFVLRKEGCFYDHAKQGRGTLEEESSRGLSTIMTKVIAEVEDTSGTGGWGVIEEVHR